MERIAVIGAGPAGLMAAEVLAEHGVAVDVYDAMPSVGRKFLLAGKGGLNLTHAEPFAAFVTRYGDRAALVRPWLDAFGPGALREWAASLGVTTFVGSSGRVFPTDMKAAPLLRSWLRRLRSRGVTIHTRHRWCGWRAGEPATTLRFATPAGEVVIDAAAVVLALGGASWKKLGSDGAWVPWLRERSVEVAPLVPANCGFDVAWSEYFATRFAGHPVKPVRLAFTDGRGRHFERDGELLVTAYGVEGSLVYAASALLRDEVLANGRAVATLDLVPGRTAERIAGDLARLPKGRSWSDRLRRGTGLTGVKAALLREGLSAPGLEALLACAPLELARRAKSWPLVLTATRPIDEVISSAGGVRAEAFDANGMLRAVPGVFCAGEMLDWEAPTGGYLLTACFASGRAAGHGVLRWLRERRG